MEERFPQLREFLFKRRSLPGAEDLTNYIRTLRPGDQFIVGVLSAIVIIASLAGIRALERKLLVVEPVYGGSLTEGVVGAPRFVNPLLALSDTDQSLVALTYAGLMGTGPNAAPVPVLAKSYIVSPDGKTYQFTLRDNATFSDGSPVTADDVVFTIQKAQDLALKSPRAGDWSGVTVTALDTKTVQFTLPAPYAPFLYATTIGILPAHLWRNVTDAEFPFADREIKPVGAGPFVTTEVTRDSSGAITHYNLTANPHYVLGRPYLDAFHFLFFPDQTSLQAAVWKGQVESGYGVTGPTVITTPYARVFAVFFNQKNASGNGSALSQIAVRQALSTAIDRNYITHILFGGYATPLAGPVPAGSGIAGLPIPTSGDRITNATSILNQAGWTLDSASNTWTDKSGNALSMTLQTSNVPELKVMAEAVQADWKKLGVPTTLQYSEPGDLTQNVIRPRAYQALLFGMVMGRGADLYDFWDSKAATDPGLNVSSYSNAAVDTLIAKIRTESDPATRTQDLSQLNQLIAQDYPAAFIESPDFVYAVPKDLKQVILPQITSPSDRFATVATWYRRTESVWPFLARQK
jgi:peptide/nickel transport system substrate-binding protein